MNEATTDIPRAEIESWDTFYEWLQLHGYEIVKHSNIFRGNKFITSFDPQEDGDSGEIEETINLIKKEDPFNFTNGERSMTEQPLMLTTPDDIDKQEGLKQTVEIIKSQLHKKKEDIVKIRLKQIGKLNILRDIKRRRFKKLIVEIYPDREEVWIDNGTWKGHKLVTFLNPTDAEQKDKDFKFKLLYY